MMLDIKMPDIAGANLDSGKERKAILEYLYQLNEQLQYTLSHISVENLDSELGEIIAKATMGDGIAQYLQGEEGKYSKLKTDVDGLTSAVGAKVGNSEVIAKINNSAETGLIAATKVDLSGYATTASLADYATTASLADYVTAASLATTLQGIYDRLTALENPTT
jgi:hypothetical protein